MFVLSILMILISSYFILSVLDRKYDFKNNIGFILYILIAFSQIILSFEILSPFKLITRNNFLLCNLIFIITTFIIWLKNGKYKYIPKIKEEFKKIKKALKRDKLLTFIAICFVIFFCSRLFYAMFFPVVYGDALHYYLPRCTMWIQNASLSHFITFDSRELIMPVNADLMYMWLLLFTKNEIGAGFFPFIFYVNAIYVIYNFLGELGFCRRKRLWSVFVFSSFALVFLECAIPGSDLWVGALMLTCFYLFLCAVKQNNSFLIWISALSYALAAGVKTTSLIAIPVSALVMLVIAVLYGKNQVKKNILYFLGFSIINFLIFSSYNYILNFIEFQNPVSDKAQFLINSFRGGIKGYLSNLIKYTFSALDYSGMPDFFHIGRYIEATQAKTLSLIGVSPDSFTSEYFDHEFNYNSKLYLINSVLGITGLLTFYPAIIYSIYRAIKNRISKKTTVLAVMSMFYILNIIIFSRVMVFTKFNMRYLLTFIVPASVVIVYTYISRNKNIYKIIIAWFLFLMLAFYSHTKPLTFIFQYIQYKSLPIEKQNNYKSFVLENCDELEIYKYFYDKNKKYIGVMLYANHSQPIYYIYKSRLLGHNVDIILPEIIAKYNIIKYDYLIIYKDFIDSTTIKNFEENKEELSKAQCFYGDFEGKTITPKDNKTPVWVSCQVPFKYIINNGFEPVNDINLSKYVILKNKQKN